jgi:iron complex outermembrane receptor protein
MRMFSQASLIGAATLFPIPSAAHAQHQAAGAAASDEEIVVTAQRRNQTQVLRSGSLGVLGDKDAMDVPFAVKGFSESLILNQQSQTLGQVLENEPSVRTTYGFANASEQFVVRGFPLNGEDIAIDGLYGITPRQLVSPELYDQVQILNGASAFLFGAAPGGSALGGTVNLMPKRAGPTPLFRATVNYNSDSHFGGAFDFGRRFGDGHFGIRINGAGRWGDVSIDDEYRASEVVGTGIDYRSGRFDVSLDLAYQRAEVRHMRPMVQVFDVRLPPPPKASINYGQPWNYTTLRDIFGLLKAEFHVTDAIEIYAAGGARDAAERGIYQTLNIFNATTGAGAAAGSQIPRNDNNEAAQAGIRARFDTGPISHEVNAGGSKIWQVNRNAFAFGDFAGAPTNLFNPVAVPKPAFTAFIGGDIADPFPISRINLGSLFASDTIGLLDGKILVTGGVRRQNIHLRSYSYFGGALTTEYDKSATTPVVGIVAKPSEHVSIYANRIEGLAQGPTAPANTINVGEVFPPFKARQYEVGGKIGYPRWNASIALYTTSRPNGITSPVNPANPAGPQLFSLNGEQRNRGLELSFDGEPTKGLRIIAGLSLNDAKLRRTQGGVNQGNWAIGVPSYTANANVEWDLAFLPGVTLTGRVVQTGRQYYNEANTLGIPSWTRLDLGARYVVAVSEHPVTFRFSVDNVANKAYWASAFGGFGGQLVQGLPRTVKLSATTNF